MSSLHRTTRHVGRFLFHLVEQDDERTVLDFVQSLLLVARAWSHVHAQEIAQSSIKTLVYSLNRRITSISRTSYGTRWGTYNANGVCFINCSIFGTYSLLNCFRGAGCTTISEWYFSSDTFSISPGHFVEESLLSSYGACFDLFSSWPGNMGACALLHIRIIPWYFCTTGDPSH